MQNSRSDTIPSSPHASTHSTGIMLARQHVGFSTASDTSRPGTLLTQGLNTCAKTKHNKVFNNNNVITTI